MGAGRLLGGATLAPMAKSFDFHNTPGHLVRRAHQRTVALFMEETAGFDVTPVQFAILHELLARPGEDQVTLASRVAFDAATSGSVIGRLENAAGSAASPTPATAAANCCGSPPRARWPRCRCVMPPSVCRSG